MFKSHCLAFTHFWADTDNSFFDWCKTVNISQENYILHKSDKKCDYIDQKKTDGLDCPMKMRAVVEIWRESLIGNFTLG